MTNKSYLYDAFGELIYLVAMADGGIQQEEISALEKFSTLMPGQKKSLGLLTTRLQKTTI